MKRSIATLATIATLSLGFAATSASAMNNEVNMLTGAVYFELKSMGLDTDNIDKLSLAQLSQIQTFIDQEEGMGRVQQIKKILSEVE